MPFRSPDTTVVLAGRGLGEELGVNLVHTGEQVGAADEHPAADDVRVAHASRRQDLAEVLECDPRLVLDRAEQCCPSRNGPWPET